MDTEIKQTTEQQPTQQPTEQKTKTDDKIVGKEYIDKDGKKYTYRISNGKRTLKDGKIVTFQYKKIYYITNKGLKRGPVIMSNKKSLRELLVKLTDAQCSEILKYVNEKYNKANTN